VATIWGRTGPGSKWTICAARANDGTIYEFFSDTAGTRGVVFGAANGTLYELNTPTQVYDFNKDASWSCPATSCDQATELLFVVDEQSVIPSSLEEYGNYIGFVKSVVRSYTERGDTFYGAVHSNALSPQAEPAAFLNVQNSFYTAMDAKRLAKAGGKTNFPALLEFALNWAWGSTSTTTPRKVIVLVGGPNEGAADFTAFHALRSSLNVEVFAYGIGFGSPETALLNNIASSNDHVRVVPSAALLSQAVGIAAAATCPANSRLCSNCNGWCKAIFLFSFF
jgi:hypothetical protein